MPWISRSRTSVSYQTRTERYDSDGDGTTDASHQVVDQITTTETYQEYVPPSPSEQDLDQPPPQRNNQVTVQVDTYVDANQNERVDAADQLIRSQSTSTTSVDGQAVYPTNTGNTSVDSANALANQFGVPGDVAQTLTLGADVDAGAAMEAVAEAGGTQGYHVGQLGDDVTVEEVQAWRAQGYEVVLWNPTGLDVQGQPVGEDSVVVADPLLPDSAVGAGDPVYDLTHDPATGNGVGFEVLLVPPEGSGLAPPDVDAAAVAPPEGNPPIGGADSNITMSDITNAVGITNAEVSLDDFYAQNPELAAAIANAPSPEEAIAIAGEALGLGTPVVVDMTFESGQALAADAQANGITYVGFNQGAVHEGNQGLVTMAGPESENGLPNLVDLNMQGDTTSTIVVAFIPPSEDPGALAADTFIAPTRRAELDQVSALVQEGYPLEEVLAGADGACPPIIDPSTGQVLVSDAELAYVTSQVVDDAMELIDGYTVDGIGMELTNPELPSAVRLSIAQNLVEQSAYYAAEMPLQSEYATREEVNGYRATTLATWALQGTAGLDYWGDTDVSQVDTATFNTFVASLDPAELQAFTNGLAIGQDWRSLQSVEMVSTVVDALMADPTFMDGGPGFLFAATVLSGPMSPPEALFNVFEESADFAQTYVTFAGQFLALEEGVEFTPEDAARLRELMNDKDTRAELGNLPFEQRILVTSYLMEHDDFDRSNVDDAEHGGLIGAVLVHRYANQYAAAEGIPFEQAYDAVLEEFEEFNFVPGAYASHLAVEANWDASINALRAGETPTLSDGSPLTPDSYITVDAETLAQFPELAALTIPTEPPVLPHANVIAAVNDGTLTPGEAADILDALAAAAEYRTSPDRLEDAGQGLFGEMAEGWIVLTSGNPYSETGLSTHGAEEAARLRQLATEIRGSSDLSFVANAFTLALNHDENVFSASTAAFGESMMYEYAESMDALGKAQLAATAVMVLASMGAGFAAGMGGGSMALGTMARIAAVQGVGSFAINAANNWAQTGDVHFLDALGSGLVDGFTTLAGMRFGMMRGLSPLAAIGGGAAIDVSGATLSAILGQPGGLQALMTGDFSNIDMDRVWAAALTSGAFSVGFGGGMYVLGAARGANRIPFLNADGALTNGQIDELAAGLTNGSLLVRNADGVMVPASQVVNPSAEGFYAVFRNSRTGEYQVQLVYSSDATSLDPMAAITAQRSNWPGEGWEPVMGFHNHPNGTSAASAGDLGADDLFKQVFGPGFRSAVLTSGEAGFTLTPFEGNGTVQMPEDYLPWNGGQRFSDDPVGDWNQMTWQEQLGVESGQTITALRRDWVPVAQDPQTGGVLWQLPNGRRFVEYPAGDGGANTYRLQNVTDDIAADAIPQGWMPIMSQNVAQWDTGTFRWEGISSEAQANAVRGRTVVIRRGYNPMGASRSAWVIHVPENATIQEINALLINPANAGAATRFDAARPDWGTGLRIWVWSDSESGITARSNAGVANIGSPADYADWDATAVLLSTNGDGVTNLPTWAR